MGDNSNNLTETLLDLNSEDPRRFITIDGQRYFLRSLDEFSTTQAYRMNKRVKTLYDKAKNMTSEEDAIAVDDGLADLFNEILIDGGDVVMKLSLAKRLKVVEVFLAQGSARKPATSAEQSSRTSPDSNASMEAGQAIG